MATDLDYVKEHRRAEAAEKRVRELEWLVWQLIDGSELLFDDLRSLRSSRICDAIDKAKNYLRSK
jgi:hypothetical protein